MQTNHGTPTLFFACHAQTRTWLPDADEFDHKRLLAVSIHLDSSALHHYSHIRLIFVKGTEDNSLEDLLIANQRYPLHTTPSNGSQSAIPYKTTLSRYKRSQKQANPVGTLPVFFSVARVFGVNDTVEYHPLPAGEALSGKWNAIVFDRTYHLDTLSRATLIYLESSICTDIVDDSIHTHSVPVRYDMIARPISLCSLRIVTNTQQGYSSNLGLRLPANPLREIAYQLCRHRHKPWRKDLLSFGLTCKPWSGVLDLFFEIHCETEDEFAGIYFYPTEEHRPTLDQIVQSLQLNQDRGSLMRRFALTNYRDVNIQRSEGCQTLYTSMAGLLRLATSLRILCIFQLPDIFVHTGILEAISALKIVKAFQVIRLVYDELMYMRTDYYACRLHNVLNTVSQWEELTEFAWHGVRTRYMDSDDDTYNDALSQAAKFTAAYSHKFSLEKLSLKDEFLTSRQFLSFFGVSPLTLKHLVLHTVFGITNQDLLSALVAASPTLTTIQFTACRFPKEPTEVHALDTAISHLNALESIEVDRWNASWVLVTSKQEQTPGSLPRLRIKEITEPSHLEHLSSALRQAGGVWGRIDLNYPNEHTSGECEWEGPSWHRDASVELKAEEIRSVARELGIDFTWTPSPLEYY